jgi:hypothetical protein
MIAISSMLAGLSGVVLTALLAVADWYLWGSRHQISQRVVPAASPRPAAGVEHQIHIRSASGRELVASLASPAPDRTVTPVEQIHCA